jgi:hypothetical protein
MITRPRHCPLCLKRWLLQSALALFAGKGHDAVGLVPILCGQFAVPL